MELTFFDSALFKWGILPLLIFCARLFDVSMGTTRIILIGRGRKYIAAMIGFFEVLIWLLAVAQVMRNLTNAMTYIAYGAGFATGTIIGVTLEEKLAVGKIMLRVISNNPTQALAQALQQQGFGFVQIQGQGVDGAVHILESIINRQALPAVREIVERLHPGAFFWIEDIRSARRGIFPAPGGIRGRLRTLFHETHSSA